jgi:hypothetical protein
MNEKYSAPSQEFMNESTPDSVIPAQPESNGPRVDAGMTNFHFT